MTKTSAIHEEMVIKANKFKSDCFSGVYGSQGSPGYKGYQMSHDQTRRKYICKEDHSYQQVFDVCSIFKDEIYEGIDSINDDFLLVFEIGAVYSIGNFKRHFFYSMAEMRDRRIDEILNEPEGEINKTSQL